jgi:EAL domain-containing protein (putative c-di-GMP-specific phosphodiesterase class I)
MLISGLDRVRQALRVDDVLCRVGRTEFAVILPHLTSRAQVMLAASKLQRALEHPVRLDSHETRMVLRVGAACAPDHGFDAAGLMQSARLALQETGSGGRWFMLFADEIRLRAENEALLEAELLRALDAGALELYLQPQVDARSGRCVGAEALLRWRDERGQFVPPTLAIELARRAGALSKLTHWVVHQSCQLADALKREGAGLRLSVNLTASDIGDSDLPDVVRDALALWNVPASLLVFELTETAMLSNEAESIEVMSRLRELGCMTSIDDFGTGYSSVLYLRKLPLDELKIDKDFVGRVTHSDQDKEIVRSLVQLAHGLGLEVVAEGVEDEATLALLREYGCERLQGFVFSTPLPIEAFVDWWRAHEQANLRSADEGA